MSQSRCSIIIRAHNEEKHLERLLTGISQQSIQDIETILVDSGSTDRTLEIAAQYPLQIVHIQPEEFTFGFSLNHGIARAQSEWVVIASAHVYPVYPDWLERLLAPFHDPQVAVVYGKQRGNATTKFSEHQLFSSWYPDRSQPRQPYPFCNNANAAIRRSLWEKVRYNETLPGLEDLDWANRIMAMGYAISYAAEAEIIHVHEETPRGVYNRYRREAMAFKRIFPQEHFRLWDFVRLFVSNTASDLWHAAQKRQLSQSLWSIFWFRWMQFWGTYQGYRQSGPLTWQLRQTFYYPGGLQSGQALHRDIAPIQYPAAELTDSTAVTGK
ncbi:MAG: glycosyltransferase family 2 protein [Anaerolineales bacterium]|nr:glycosyltransferase family 2 protein [Anaerolineales bacterium]